MFCTRESSNPASASSSGPLMSARVMAPRGVVTSPKGLWVHAHQAEPATETSLVRKAIPSPHITRHHAFIRAKDHLPAPADSFGATILAVPPLHTPKNEGIPSKDCKETDQSGRCRFQLEPLGGQNIASGCVSINQSGGHPHSSRHV